MAEELCKTASSGHCGPLHSFGHDMPLLPSKSRTTHKHTENKENIEGGLDGRPNHGMHSHSGTARHPYLTTNHAGARHYDSAGTAENTTSESTLQRRQARRLRRRAVIFLNNWRVCRFSAVSQHYCKHSLTVSLFWPRITTTISPLYNLRVKIVKSLKSIGQIVLPWNLGACHLNSLKRL